MSDTTRVDNRTLSVLLLYAFRYALGRMTSAPTSVSDAIRRYRHVLPDEYVRQMVEDIDRAIRSGDAGWECDARVWRQLATWLREERGR